MGATLTEGRCGSPSDLARISTLSAFRSFFGVSRMLNSRTCLRRPMQISALLLACVLGAAWHAAGKGSRSPSGGHSTSNLHALLPWLATSRAPLPALTSPPPLLLPSTVPLPPAQYPPGIHATRPAPEGLSACCSDSTPDLITDGDFEKCTPGQGPDSKYGTPLPGCPSWLTWTALDFYGSTDL